MLVIVLEIMCMLILVCVKKVFNFLLGGRSINNSTREWKDLLKCQMKSGAYSDTPFLVVTAALLQSISSIDLYLLLLASNGLCSIGSNRIVLLLPRASMLKKQ